MPRLRRERPLGARDRHERVRRRADADLGCAPRRLPGRLAHPRSRRRLSATQSVRTGRPRAARRDLLAARRAGAVRAVVDAGECRLDLAQDLLGVLLETVVELPVVRVGGVVGELVRAAGRQLARLVVEAELVLERRRPRRADGSAARAARRAAGRGRRSSRPPARSRRSSASSLSSPRARRACRATTHRRRAAARARAARASRRAGRAPRRSRVRARAPPSHGHARRHRAGRRSRIARAPGATRRRRRAEGASTPQG